MIQLKFYASKKGHYHNKLFCFNIKKQEEIGNILLPFAQNANSFNAIYVNDLYNNYSYKLSILEARQLVHTTALLKGIRIVSVLVSVLFSLVNL